MLNPAFKISPINLVLAVGFLLGLNPVLYAQDTSVTVTGNYGYVVDNDAPEVKKGTTLVSRESPSEDTPRRKVKLNILQEQARFYRAQGLELQDIGDLESAMAFYQKAVDLDPAYAVAYNDLGVIYESQGWTDRAEESYLKAIKINPDYLSPYTNLAMLCENKRQLQEAAFFWRKRADLGQPNDPWTEKARSRLEDILLVLGEKPDRSLREEEVLNFMQEVAAKLSADKQEKEKEEPFKKVQQDNRSLSKDYLNKAKQSYEKGNYDTALQQALEAQQLDPSNKNAGMFIEELQRRLLSR